MVNMLKYIVLVAYFTGALGDFSSTYTCEDIEEAITEPVTLDQIAGTWYDVARVKGTYQKCGNRIITNEKGADGKMKPQQKITANYYDGTTGESNITLDTTAVGRFNVEGYLSFWMVKTGVDFTEHALKLNCYNEPTNLTDEKSNVLISMLSRTKTLSNEDKKIIMDKLNTITDLGNAELEMCPPPPASATSDAVEADSVAGNSAIAWISSSFAFLRKLA